MGWRPWLAVDWRRPLRSFVGVKVSVKWSTYEAWVKRWWPWRKGKK